MTYLRRKFNSIGGTTKEKILGEYKLLHTRFKHSHKRKSR